MTSQHKENRGFEAQVRQVAEAVWGLEPGACQPAYYEADTVIRELDGIARTRDVTHLLMVTTSRKLDKLRDDVKKLNAAESIEKKRVLSVVKWFISREQFEAPHIEFAKKNNVTALTLDQFKRRFFDADKYISLRANHYFGSARNPEDNSLSIPYDAYVPLPMSLEEKNALHATTKGDEAPPRAVEIDRIIGLLLDGKKIVMVAPFGSGKSLTTREIHSHLVALYRDGKSDKIPLTINLREHWGQEYGDEILERHSRAIGFGRREDLVVAWRAGMVHLLLDGFDEVASQSIVRIEDRHFMRDARRIAMTGVKDLLSKAPSGVGILICGRDHYFDNRQELEHTLGFGGDLYYSVILGEFSEGHANAFLKKHGIDETLPDWVPRKPLILSYLVRANLFDFLLSIDASLGFGHAWDEFITRICEREANLERVVMDPSTVRAVLERLAHWTRTSLSGSGPISSIDLHEAYKAETGQVAGEGVLAQLQRLPGLTQRDQEAGARSFVDDDMLSALQGGALGRMILGQFNDKRMGLIAPLSNKALGMGAYVLSKNGATSDVAISVASRLSKNSASVDMGLRVDPQLVADCAAIAMALSIESSDGELDFRHLIVDSGAFRSFNFEETVIKNLELRNCVIEDVALGPTAIESSVRFVGCVISRVRGVASKDGLPKNIFGDGCEVEEFDAMSTNSAVLRSDLAPGVKALLTVLRKVYKQAGAGRKISALSRGITHPKVSNCIPSVLDALQKAGLVSVYNQIVHPVRKQQGRVEQILRAPAVSEDEIVAKARALGV